MPYKMDQNGNWTFVAEKKDGSKTDSTAKKVDKTNTTDTNSAISETASNQTDAIKYAEEATFTCDGDYQVRKGCKLDVRKGVASRWKGEWDIIETSHTIDLSGYKIEGRCGRIPYSDSKFKDGASSGKSNSDTTAKKDSKTDPTKSDDSSAIWKMDASGKWMKQ